MQTQHVYCQVAAEAGSLCKVDLKAGLHAGDLLDDRRPKKLQRFAKDGQGRDRWFADDDKDVSVEAMAQQQRVHGAADIDANLAHNIAAKARYKCALLPLWQPGHV